MSKEIPEHKDILGNVIEVGNTVVYPQHNNLRIATVKKINPKMINVLAVGKSNWRGSPDRKYPDDLLVVNDPKITLYLLKHAK